MMGYTHGWFRSMIQSIHPNVFVMSEMITMQTLKHCPNHASLWCHPLETAPSLQIAGASVELVREIKDQLIALPFEHINLNAGCPSPQVGQACMGAAMMYYPEITRDVLRELLETNKAISIKTRLAVDDKGDEFWEHWFNTVLASGVEDIFLHARTAILSGLNPAQNRQIPPLRYDRALEIASMYPDLSWVLNGGLNTIELIERYRFHEDLRGVMLGRIAYQDPMIFWKLAEKDGVADVRRIKLWLASVQEDVLCYRMIGALLSLTKGLKNSKKLRESIVLSKGKKYNTAELMDQLFESHIKK